MLKKLRLRLTLICTASTAAVLCVISIALLAASEKKQMDAIQAAFDGNIAVLAYRLQNEDAVRWDWLSQMETDQQLAIAIEDQGAALRYPGAWRTETDRGLLLSAVMEKARGLTPSPDGTAVRKFALKGARGERYLGAAAAVPAGRSRTRTLYLVKDLRRADLYSLRLRCAVLTAGSVLVLAAFSWWFSGKSIAPVEQSIRRQNEFVAAASHELRSPLAVLRANAAALRYKTDASGRPFAEALDGECARLGRLVDDLLCLAAADAGRLSMKRGPVEADQLLREAGAAFSSFAASKGVALKVSLPQEPLPVLAGDVQRLAQMLSVFIENALRYAPGQGGRIELSARREGVRIVLSVADNGPGIPEGDRDRVFERFYRADAARGQKEHLGLGMSIAADIARLHGGTLRLRETRGGGLTVEYRQAAGKQGGI